jgi:hypothetical protein
MGRTALVTSCVWMLRAARMGVEFTIPHERFTADDRDV